jgi:ABC-2 type transport system permease protein
MIKQLLKLTRVEALLMLREPMATFFILIFPLLVLFVFGSVFGNEPFPGSTLGAVDIATPGYMAMTIGTTALMYIPVAFATYREQGVLRRLRATPLRPAELLGAQLIVRLAVTLIGIIGLVVAARLFYGLKLPEAPLGLIAAFLLSSLSFFAVGTVLASLAATPRVAQAIGTAIYFPMMFLSGAAFPREIMPETVRTISDFLPLTHVTILISDLWFGQGWNLTSLAVLTGMLVIGGVAAAAAFRWE